MKNVLLIPKKASILLRMRLRILPLRTPTRRISRRLLLIPSRQPSKNQKRRDSASSSSSSEGEHDPNAPNAPKRKTTLKNKVAGGMKTAMGKIKKDEEMIAEGQTQRGH
ncbi:hypothetical protein RSAG8_13811, partial [Rhizoctonia solani AG-8 WAC10335]